MSTAPIRRFQFAAVAVFFVLPLTLLANESKAQSIGLFPYSAQQRAYIRSLPITQRPNRPFHFYGNAVRRNAARSSRTDAHVVVQPPVQFISGPDAAGVLPPRVTLLAPAKP